MVLNQSDELTYDISVVIPVFQNERSLSRLFARLDGVLLDLQSRDKTVEIVFVNDGCKDGSQKLLVDYQSRRENVKVVELTRNFGATTAVKEGFRHTSGKCVTVLPADLQDPPELILEMFPRWEAGSLVTICNRRTRKDPFFSRILSKLYYKLIRKVISPEYPLDGGDVFLIDRSLVHHLTNSSKSAYLQMLVHWLGYLPTYIPYDRANRLEGKSQWSIKKRISTAIDVLLNFSATPIHVASILCLAVSIIGFIYSILVILVRVIEGGQAPGYAATLVFVSMFLICLSMASAIQGEYIIRIWGELNRQPEVVVKQVISKAQGKRQFMGSSDTQL
jgi:dolichol-phosphate mannosyltransferase